MNNFIKNTGIYSINDLEKHYVKKTKGYWFTKSSMAFFNSKVNEKLFYKPETKKILFISSERFDSNTPRRYSIREYNTETGSIETVGLGFQGYKTLAAAILAAGKL